MEESWIKEIGTFKWETLGHNSVIDIVKLVTVISFLIFKGILLFIGSEVHNFYLSHGAR